MTSRKRFDRIIHKHRIKDMKEGDIFPASTFHRLVEDFKDYDRRKSERIIKAQEEITQLKNTIKEKNQLINELRKEIKELKKREDDMGWILDSNLPEPLPEM